MAIGNFSDAHISDGGGNVTSSGGTTGTIAKFTGPTTIGDSIITETPGKITVAGTIEPLNIDLPESATPPAPDLDKIRIFAVADADFTVLETITDLGVVNRINQDTFRVARNTTGAPIATARAVYYTGSTDNKPNFAMAKADSSTTMPAVGITTATVANGNFGEIMIIGRLTGFDTSAWNEGDSLYVSASTAGELTNVKPSFPNIIQWVGTVEVKSATVGVILVHVQSLETDVTTQRIGTLINSANSKTPPIDADQLGLMDSAAGNILTKLSWANVKATLKTYFDTLYASITGVRERLTAARTYYVRTDGNDANTGLVNSAAGAFLTIQKAVNTSLLLDSFGYGITIQVGDGTYSEAVNVLGPKLGAGIITIQGNTSSTSAVLIEGGTSVPITVSGMAYSQINLRSLKLQATGLTGARYGLFVFLGSYVNIDKVNFGACGIAHILCYKNSFITIANGGYTISGAAGAHVYCYQQSNVDFQGGTITISGTPAFSTAFINASNLALVIFSGTPTWSGSATGKRFNSEVGAVINTAGQATTWLPGDVTGTTATGGQYI